MEDLTFVVDVNSAHSRSEVAVGARNSYSISRHSRVKKQRRSDVGVEGVNSNCEVASQVERSSHRQSDEADAGTDSNSKEEQVVKK
jgi:hypothetical protein